jgi:D-glycero-D-manno-heptose 1,7-bisphosphate phosphatase
LTKAKALRPAVFLDRDGTICEEVGYLNHISRLQIFPYSAGAIRRLNDARVPVIVVTNQSGIGRGIITESLVVETHARIAAALAGHGAHVDGFYYCAHTRQDQCGCRKPLPGLLEQAAREHSLDLGRSFVVGDRYVDVELAHAVGARGLLVMTGYGRGEYELHGDEWSRPPHKVVENLAAAVDVILAELA